VLAQALDMDADQKASRIARLREVIRARQPDRWLHDQLDAVR
jgi:trehalose-6-phosphate synthase